MKVIYEHVYGQIVDCDITLSTSSLFMVYLCVWNVMRLNRIRCSFTW